MYKCGKCGKIFKVPNSVCHPGGEKQTECPHCKSWNFKLIDEIKTLPISESFIVSFDLSADGGGAVLLVSNSNSKKLVCVNMFTGKEAVVLYDKLANRS